MLSEYQNICVRDFDPKGEGHSYYTCLTDGTKVGEFKNREE